MTSLHARPDQAGAAAATARVVLIGPPSSLRAAVARELRGSAALLGCLDSPARLSQALSAVNGSAGFSGAAVVFATVPRLPGVASGLRHRFRGAALAAAFADAVTACSDSRRSIRRTFPCSCGRTTGSNSRGMPPSARL